MGKKRGVHTAVVLPPEVLDQLRKSERGVSEEIRRRIALTFEQDAADRVIRELCDEVRRIADKLRQDFGAEWHTFAQSTSSICRCCCAANCAVHPSSHDRIRGRLRFSWYSWSR